MSELKKYLSIIDHTLLRSDAKTEDVEKCCKDAIEYGFFSVCLQPYYVNLASILLKDSKVLCGTVVGFPFGSEITDVKEYQAEKALENGAQEIDMVMHQPAFKNKDYKTVLKDIERVVLKVKVPVKVIIETSLLKPDEIIKACHICIDGGAAFVKTSTGYIGEGATIENVRLMKEACAGKIKIKAAGGVRSYEDLKGLVLAGADRIGTSNGVKIANSLENKSGY